MLRMTASSTCPSLVRSTSFEPCLTEVERTKNRRNDGINDAPLYFKPSTPSDPRRLPATDQVSDQRTGSTDTKTSESMDVYFL